MNLVTNIGRQLPIMRFVTIVVGAGALVLGLIFAGQGANLIPGSSMTGDRTWLYIGAILAVAGLVVLIQGLKKGTRQVGRAHR